MPGRGPWAQARLLSLIDSDKGRLVCARGRRLDRVTWMEMRGNKQRGSEKAREIRKTVEGSPELHGGSRSAFGKPGSQWLPTAEWGGCRKVCMML